MQNGVSACDVVPVIVPPSRRFPEWGATLISITIGIVLIFPLTVMAQGSSGTPDTGASASNTALRDFHVKNRAITGFLQGQAMQQKYAAESEFYAGLAKPFALAKSFKGVVDGGFTIKVPPQFEPFKKAAQFGWGTGNAVGGVLSKSISIDMDDNGQVHFLKRPTAQDLVHELPRAAGNIAAASLKYRSAAPGDQFDQFGRRISVGNHVVKTYDALKKGDYVDAATNSVKVIGNAIGKELGKTLDTAATRVSAGQQIYQGFAGYNQASKLEMPTDLFGSEKLADAISRFRTDQQRDLLKRSSGTADVTGPVDPTSNTIPDSLNAEHGGLATPSYTTSNPLKPLATEIGLQNPFAQSSQIPVPQNRGGLDSGAELDKALNQNIKIEMGSDNPYTTDLLIRPHDQTTTSAEPSKGTAQTVTETQNDRGGITVGTSQQYKTVPGLKERIKQMGAAASSEKKKP